MPQLKNMTSHLDPGAGVRAGLRWADSVISRKGFEIQMCYCITMPCATNECLIIWGVDGSLLTGSDLNADVTRTQRGGRGGINMTLRF